MLYHAGLFCIFGRLNPARIMKKLGLLALLLTLTVSVWAQRGWQIGLRAMPHTTWLLNQTDSDAGKDVFAYKTTWGMAAGLWAGYGINNHMTVGLNVFYSSQGQNHTYEVPDAQGGKDTVLNELRLRYVKIPLLFKLSTDAERKFSYYIEAGPQIGILASVNEENDNKNYVPFPPVGVQYYDDYPTRYETFQPVVVSGVVGFGVDVKLRFNLRMNISARFEGSFHDVEKKSVTYTQMLTDGSANAGVPTTEYYYPQDRAATFNLVGSLGIGFTYTFIPRFHY